jgi:hypothetical protein
VSIGSSGFWFCNCVVSNCRNVLKLLAIIVKSTAIPLELVEVLAAVPLVDGVEVADLATEDRLGLPAGVCSRAPTAAGTGKIWAGSGMYWASGAV